MLQVLIIINAILLLLSIPVGMPFAYEVINNWLIFLMLIFLTIKLYRKEVTGVAFYFFIIALYYNPLFFAIQKMHTPPVADGMIAVTFFLIALSWNYLSSEK